MSRVSVADRFWSKVDKPQQGSNCCLWTASLDSHGYGQMLVNGKLKRSHRIAYWLEHGEWPRRLLTICGDRRCVNLSHWAASREEAFWTKVDKSGECWVWTGGLLIGGYGSFTWEGRPQGAHRFAWFLEHGPIPKGMYICHHCDNPPCIRIDHLFIGTAADNSADMAAKGRAHKHPGELSHGAKLTDAQAIEIRQRYDGPRGRGVRRYPMMTDLAPEYGVCLKTIQAIIYRKTFTHLS